MNEQGKLTLVRSADKRSDLYIRREGWKVGERAVARAFDQTIGRDLVDSYNGVYDVLANSTSLAEESNRKSETITALLEALKTANAFLSWLAQEGKCGDLEGWEVAQQEVHAAIALASQEEG
jgi:hypothetical protein